MTEKEIDAIIKWQYWLYNHGDIKEIFHEIWPGLLADHFYAKFLHFCEKYNNYTNFALLTLFMEMSRENQKKLAEYVVKNYKC